MGCQFMWFQIGTSGLQVGDMVLQKVSPWKCIIRFNKRSNLGPKYIRHFRLLARVGLVVYLLDLPEELSQIHSMFHVSQQRKILVEDSVVVPLEDIHVDDCMNYIKRPMVFLDRKKKTLRNKVVELVKVQWQHHKSLEWTWEPEDEMREHYPELFDAADFEDEV